MRRERVPVGDSRLKVSKISKLQRRNYTGVENSVDSGSSVIGVVIGVFGAEKDKIPPGVVGCPAGWLKLARLALARLVLDDLGELLDLVVGRASLRHLLADLPIGIHHGRVILAAELVADLRQ